MCNECIDLYFREVSKSLYDADVCTPCNCYDPGVVNGDNNCAKVIDIFKICSRVHTMCQFFIQNFIINFKCIPPSHVNRLEVSAAVRIVSHRARATPVRTVSLIYKRRIPLVVNLVTVT